MPYERGKLIIEGKTKLIYQVVGEPQLCIAESKDDITAGDGAKHDVMGGKAAMANRTTCNVFRLLTNNRRHIPLAFLEQLDETSFLAYRASMLPWEVVARREALGSYLKRYPEVAKGHRFDPPLVEFFLKTTGKKWRGQDLPEDDPFAVIDADGSVRLYNPKFPFAQQEPFLVERGIPGQNLVSEMARITIDTFESLEKAWAKVGGRLIDFKIEFGLIAGSELVVADVIDNDSWRVLGENGEHIDKQAYRDGADMADVTAKYRYVAELTSKF